MLIQIYSTQLSPIQMLACKDHMTTDRVQQQGTRAAMQGRHQCIALGLG